MARFSADEVSLYAELKLKYVDYKMVTHGFINVIPYDYDFFNYTKNTYVCLPLQLMSTRVHTIKCSEQLNCILEKKKTYTWIFI